MESIGWNNHVRGFEMSWQAWGMGGYLGVLALQRLANIY
jgi:hypothetical protein